jgi:hypothetical protein
MKGTQTMANYEKIVTPEFTLMYPSLFEPRAYEGGTPKYSLTAVFPKGADLSALKNLARSVVPAGKESACRTPFREATEEQIQAWGEVYRDAIFIRLSSQRAPGIVDAMKKVITDSEEIYSGAKCRAVIHAYFYERSGNKGVNFGLDAVQKTADGERMYADSSAMFDAVPGGATTTAKSDSDLF